MRSRSARVMFSAVAWIGIAGAAIFLVNSEQQLAARRIGLREFDQHAREAAAAIGDLRAGQQAYVAAGQGVAFWMPKVEALLTQTTATVERLRASGLSSGAQQELVQAAAAITQLNNVDRRARDYLRAGEQLMASDVVFSDGGDVAATAVHQIETARLAESRAFDAEEADRRNLEALALAGAAALAAIVLAVLAFAHGPAVSSMPAARTAALQAGDNLPRASTTPLPVAAAVLSAPTRSSAAAVAGTRPATSDQAAVALAAAASLCTEFGSVRDLADLSRLLVRAGTLMNASGLIVWLGGPDGADLRPVLAHGYAEQTLARIPPVPRSADNAAAAAYRTGSLQVVAARPGGPAGASGGALVAPILTGDGCIGALTAEIDGRGESSETVQALATIFASQLAGVLGASVAAGAAETEHQAPPATNRMASA